MYLNQLNIHHFRNIRSLSVQLSPELNIFFGKNGSGKTSLLEAVYMLTTGRSFRTSRAQEFIQLLASSCVVAGVIHEYPAPACYVSNAFEHLASPVSSNITKTRIGIQRESNGGKTIRINEEECRSRSELAKLLPIQIMNTESHQLFDLPSKVRREFLDWGVFHVEHSFFSLWSRYNRALKQRNAALKRAFGDGEGPIIAWEEELATLGETIHRLRAGFLEQLIPIFHEFLGDFLKIALSDLQMRYQKGWNKEKTLAEALSSSRGRDIALGHTVSGAHRADFKFYIDEMPIESMLSRGQLKLFVSALMLARHVWLKRVYARQSLFLMDDICSELDTEAWRRLLQGLRRIGGQVWVTAVELPVELEELLQMGDFRMFHVEQGGVKEVAPSI